MITTRSDIDQVLFQSALEYTQGPSESSSEYPQSRMKLWRSMPRSPPPCLRRRNLVNQAEAFHQIHDLPVIARANVREFSQPLSIAIENRFRVRDLAAHDSLRHLLGRSGDVDARLKALRPHTRPGNPVVAQIRIVLRHVLHLKLRI